MGATASWRVLNDLTPGTAEHAEQLEEFTQARRAHGKQASELYGALRDLWPRSHERREELEEVADGLDAGEEPAFRAFQALLEARIEELAPQVEEDLESFEEAARAEIERRQLVIEAFIVPHEDSREAHAVHVEGYDDLDAESVTRIDGKGLALTQSEREYLNDLMATSRELADALEKVRLGESTLAEAFASAKTAFGQKIAAQLEEFQGLADDLRKEELERLRDETR